MPCNNIYGPAQSVGAAVVSKGFKKGLMRTAYRSFAFVAAALLCWPGLARGELPEQCECITENRETVEDCKDGEKVAVAVQCLFKTSYCGEKCDEDPISLNDWFEEINDTLRAVDNPKRLGFESPVVAEFVGGEGGEGDDCVQADKVGKQGYARTARNVADLIGALSSTLLHFYIGEQGQHGQDSKGAKGAASSLLIGQPVEQIEKQREPEKEGVIGIAGGGGGGGSCIATFSGGSGGNGACAISYLGAPPEDESCNPDNGRDVVVEGTNASATGGRGGQDGGRGGNEPGPGDIKDGAGGKGHGNGKDGNDGIGGLGGSWRKGSVGYTEWVGVDNRHGYHDGRGGNGAQSRGGGGGGGFGGGGGGQGVSNKDKGSGGGGGGGWIVAATEEEAGIPFYGRDDLIKTVKKNNAGLRTGVAALTFELLPENTGGETLDVERAMILSRKSRVKPGGHIKLKGEAPGSWYLPDGTVVTLESVLKEGDEERLVGASGGTLLPMELAMSKGGKKPVFEGEKLGARVRLKLNAKRGKFALRMKGTSFETPQACDDGDATVTLATRIALGSGPIRDALMAETEWECRSGKLRPVNWR